MTLKTNAIRKHSSFLDPFLTALYNYDNLSENSEIKTIIDKLVTSPHRYVILLPKIENFLFVSGFKTKTLNTLCSDLLFIQSHIIDTKTSHSFGNESSVSTIHGDSILFQNGELLTKQGDVESGKSKVDTENLIYSTVSYLYPGYKLQVCFIECPLIFTSGYKVPQNSLNRFRNNIEGQDGIVKDASCEDFSELMKDSPELADYIGPKFRGLFLSFDVGRARNEGELMSLFLDIIAEAFEIVRSLPTPTHSILIKKYSEESLHQAIYDYVEMNVYDKVWPRFLDFCRTPTDRLLNASYEDFQHMCISQLGLPDLALEDTSLIQLFLGRVVKVINDIKMLDYLLTSSKKLDVLSRAIIALSHNPSKSNSKYIIDADTLLSLVILVLGTAGVTDIQCHVKYIRKYYPSPEKFQSGTLGYVISTIEAALGYLTDESNIRSLAKQCKANEELWNTICFSVEDPSWTTIPKNIDRVQEHYLRIIIGSEMVHSLAAKALRSRNLRGESCLLMAIKHRNWPAFKTLIDLYEIYDLNFILTDTDISGSTLLQSALMEGDSRVIQELVEIISEATESEIEFYCSKINNLGRNLGHYLMYYKPLVQIFGARVNWRQVDCLHQTPLATIVRCYDHPNYQDLLEAVLHIVHEWYAKRNLSFDLKDHLDAKNNSLLHSIKDGRTLDSLLKVFPGLDVNYPNSQSLTPLMFSIKHNKFSNVCSLLSDEKIDISRANARNHLTAFDYIKTSMLESSLLQESERFSSLHSFKLKVLTIMSRSFLQNLCPKNSIRSAVIITRRYSAGGDAFLYLFLMSENSLSSRNGGSIARHKESELLKMLTAIKLSRPHDFPQMRLPFLEQLSNTSNQHFSFGHTKRLVENDRTSQLNLLLASLTMNEERGIDDEIWKLLSKETSLGNSNQSQRSSPVRKEFSSYSVCENLISAQNFVKLTCDDLLRCLEIYERFHRQHALLGILWSDIERLYSWKPCGTEPYDKLDHMSHYTGIKGILNTSATILSMCKNANGEKLLDALSFFFYLAKDLRDELEYFSDAYIERGWSLFSQISELQDHCRELLQRQQYSPFASTSYAQLSQLAESLDEYLVESRYPCLKSAGVTNARNSSTTHFAYKQSSFFSIFDISRFSEKNRIMQTKKLVESFSAIKGDIDGLAKRFRAGYESLTVELSNFHLFKKRFFPIVLKQFAKMQIETLKLQHNRLKLDRERFLLKEPT